MSTQSPTLMSCYGGWKNYQRPLINMIAQLSPEQLAYPVQPDGWTIGMVAQHMIADRVWWYHGWMEQGSPDLAPLAHWDPADTDVESPVPDVAELVAGLESTWQMISDALTRWTPADLEYVYSPPDFLSDEDKEDFGDCPRGWIIWHVLEHEIHHGGELSLALGNLGLKGRYSRW
jgi:uncharacterized damage-inducible protein DinB